MSDSSTPTKRLLLRADDVAEMLQISRSGVYDLVKRGELPSVRIGGSVRIPAAAIDRIVAGEPAPNTATARTEKVATEAPDVRTAADRFVSQIGMTAEAFVEGWRTGSIEDSPENSRIMARALGIREALAQEAHESPKLEPASTPA